MADAQITSGQKLKSTANTRGACVANYLEKQERVQPSKLKQCTPGYPDPVSADFSLLSETKE